MLFRRSIKGSPSLMDYLADAEMGNGDAQLMVGDCYEYGLGTSIDLDSAKKWYALAAEQGNEIAQYKLGSLMEFGKNPNTKQAAYWYKEAAERGHGYAQYKLGLCYETGSGVEQDISQAAYWYSRAKGKGVREARKHLKAIQMKIKKP